MKLYKCQVKTKYTNETVWNIYQLGTSKKHARIAASQTLERVEPYNFQIMTIGEITIAKNYSRGTK